MILSAPRYDVFDRCPRRYALERTHEPRSISPLGLMYAGVEGGAVLLIEKLEAEGRGVYHLGLNNTAVVVSERSFHIVVRLARWRIEHLYKFAAIGGVESDDAGRL